MGGWMDDEVDGKIEMHECAFPAKQMYSKFC